MCGASGWPGGKLGWLKSMSSRRRIPGAFVNINTGEAIPLAVFTGTDPKRPDTTVVLDLMLGIGPKEFTGSSLSDALDDFQDRAKVKYPKGRIYLRTSVIKGERDRAFDTEGKSWWGKLAGYFGIGSGVAMFAGFIAALIGWEPVAWGLFAAAAAVLRRGPANS